MNYLKILSIPLAISAVPSLARANETGDGVVFADTVRDTYITVVATGQSQALNQTAQSISVIGADEIAKVQGPDLTRVLERLPGVVLTRNGGLGGFTGLRVRGANSEQVLVLVDGIRIADVASPGGGYDFGNLATGGIGKIELLRGSNSVAWGSEAIGGVLAVTSRRLDGAEASAEFGARDTLDANVTAGLVRSGHDFTLSGGYTRTDGVSSAASGSEPDGFRQWRLNGRGSVRIADGLSFLAAGRFADSRLDIDGFPAPLFVFADTPEFQDTREASGRAGLEYWSSRFRLSAGFAMSGTRREYFDPTLGTDPTYETRGSSRRADLKAAWDITDSLRLDFGADHEWSRFSSSSDSRKKARLASGHALIGWYGPDFNVAAGIRLDDHSRFGSDVTFGANGSIDIADGWRLRASYGEGFKVPTLYQLFSDFGNAALNPERSRSYDVGIETGDRNSGLHMAVTAFRRDSRSLIDFVSCFSVGDPLCDDGRFGFYANVGKARAEGVEVELGAQVSDRLRAQAVYSYVRTRNRTAGDANRGNDLARRPHHAVTVALDWLTPLHDLELGADIRLVGDSFDDAGNFTPIDGYAVGTVRASLPLTEQFELFGRVENLTDERYETAAGYGTAGRSAHVGARARF
ncbi:MAG: TonB-dependent receptor [Novosphingobium sp.]|nr:TonB-dependent receptor [Novosphingobium sp.]MCP5402339.1 TonB-dependent receptor [Novosphingobium sp.]